MVDFEEEALSVRIGGGESGGWMRMWMLMSEIAVKA